jgi:hypothetical protein
MATLSWKYSVKIDIEETVANAEKAGLKVVWQYGQSKTNNEEYSLNQFRLVGGCLNPNLKVQMYANYTEFFYNLEKIPNILEIQDSFRVIKDTEQYLNSIAVFAAGETRRYSEESQTPILSIGMLTLLNSIEKEWQEAVTDLQKECLMELNNILHDISLGNSSSAESRLNSVSFTLTTLLKSIFSELKDWKDPQYQEMEKQLKSIISDP